MHAWMIETGRSRGVAHASSLGGAAVTRLDKAEDVLGGEAIVKKPWDYVAHHPKYVLLWGGIGGKREVL